MKEIRSKRGRSRKITGPLSGDGMDGLHTWSGRRMTIGVLGAATTNSTKPET